MVAYELKLNRAAVDKAADLAALRLVTDVTRRVLNRAIILTPVKTGTLRAANNMRVKRDAAGIVGEVFNDTAYSAAVHNGTKAHKITPKRAKVLRFKATKPAPKPAKGKRKRKGNIVYTPYVNHPGTKARPWLATALREVAGPAGFTVTV